MAEEQIIKIRTVRFDRGLIIVVILACIVLSASILLSFHVKHPSKIIFLGAIFSVIISYCSYPFILKIYTTETLLLFSDSSLKKQQRDRNVVNYIDWDKIKSYQIHAFESLYGSGFTFMVHLKNGANRKMSFIGINLMDNYNIQNPNSLIFKLTQNINDYNSHQLPQNHIKLVPGFFASKILTYILSVFSGLGTLLFIYYSSTSFSVKNDLVPFFFFLIILATFYSKRRKSRILYEKIYRLHSR